MVPCLEHPLTNPLNTVGLHSFHLKKSLPGTAQPAAPSRDRAECLRLGMTMMMGLNTTHVGTLG